MKLFKDEELKELGVPEEEIDSINMIELGFELFILIITLSLILLL